MAPEVISPDAQAIGGASPTRVMAVPLTRVGIGSRRRGIPAMSVGQR
jgi:hypothetical protein